MDTQGRTPAQCTACPNTLVASRTWKRADWRQRIILRAAGAREHKGRGLCSVCYTAARKAGTLIDFERTTMPTAEALEEYQRYNGSGQLSRREACRQLAPRMGMTPDALEKALERAQAADQAVAA